MMKSAVKDMDIGKYMKLQKRYSENKERKIL